jgi:hypothetical protein
MMTFDPRTISTPVCTALQELRSPIDGNSQIGKDKKNAFLKDQKNQAIEIYSYLATWGMLRLKAEETFLQNKNEKRERQKVLKSYFKCLQALSEGKKIDDISDDALYDLEYLKTLPSEKYLGLTGLGLEIAQEFSFWANAIYHDIKGEQ